MFARSFSFVAAFFLLSSVAVAESPISPISYGGYSSGGERNECDSCHQENKGPGRYDSIRPWLESRHAAAGVTCIDCHLKEGVKGDDFYRAVTAGTKGEAHGYILPDPAAREKKLLFVGICGGCHKERLEEFRGSVHGSFGSHGAIPGALSRGLGVSCIDCHDAHRAPAVSERDSRLYRGNDLKTCGRCHRDMLDSYKRTFHGKQFVLGNTLVPTCTYCHIGHEPSTDDPASVLSASNVGSICAGCHGESVAKGAGADEMMIHNLSRDSTRKVIHFRDPVKVGPFSIASTINSSYIMMIIGVVGFFTLLSTRDFMKKTKGGVDHSGREGERSREKKSVKRFSISWRLQHLFWALSFIVLASTGLSLKFPDSTFSQLVLWLVGGEAERSSVHRLAAVVFILTAVAHIVQYLLLSRRPTKILFTKKDFLDAVLHISYLFDRTEKMPLMGRYTWYQKVEYFATVVGATIVIITGFVMWGFVPLVKEMPLALVFYAQMIHGWEAILAVLVIFVQHLYHTVLNPLVFPMDLSWLTGRTSRAVMEHDHPLELMEIETVKGEAEGTDAT